MAAFAGTPAAPERFEEKWKHFSGSETRQDQDLEPFVDFVKS